MTAATMRAALLPSFGAPLVVDTVPIPRPGPGEVLVRVEASGVCHSDLHLARGEWPDACARMRLPAILGHEVVGTVVETGAAVRGVAAGARVGVGWLHSVCGRCEPCRTGAENVCLERTVTSIESPGGHAEYAVMRADQAVAVPAGVPSAEAAPLFCAGLTVFHAARRAGVGRQGGETVGVFGVGGLGHLAVQIARNAGAEVLAVDVAADKLALALQLGAAAALDARSADTLPRLLADGGLHVALVTAASKPAYDLAFKALRRRGTLAVVGLPKEDLTFFADDLAVSEARILGNAVGTREETRELLDMAARGEIACAVEAVPLDAVNEVFARLDRGAIPGRAVLDLRASV